MIGKLTARIKRHVIPLCILVVSLTVSVLGWQAARYEELREAHLAFTRAAQSYQHRLERRMTIDFRFLADLSGLMETNDPVTYQQFTHFIDHVNNMMGIRGVQHLGYFPVGRVWDRSGHVSGSNLAVMPGSQIQMAPSPGNDLLLAYVYPNNESTQQKQLDKTVLNTPVSLEARQKARDLGRVIATGKLDSTVSGLGHPSILLFAPVYRKPPQPNTLPQRRAAIRGFVYEAFQTSDLLWAAWGEHFESMLDVHFAVEDAPGKFSTIYSSMTPDNRDENFLYVGRFYSAGRAWSLSLRAPIKAYTGQAEALPLTTLLGGILTSLLLTVLCALWDERRHTAKIQQEQNQRFRSLFDQNPDAVYSLDLKGNFTAANKRTERLAGKPETQLFNISARAVVAPDKRQESSRRLDLALQGQATFGETAIVKGTGERIELEVTNLPIIVDGKLEGVFGIAKDITARKRVEAALQNFRAELEGRVRERTVALRQEIEARQQSEVTLRQLAGHQQSVREEERARVAREIHDEIGGALAAIKFDLSVPMWQGESCSDQGMQRNQDMLRLVDDAITALRRIISDLRPCMLDDLGLWATLDWLAHEFEGRMGIRVLFDLEGEEVEITPELATAIFRIVQESLNNVAKHAQASQVEILATTTAHAISIVIQDNGKGFSPDASVSPKSYGIQGMHERAQAFNGTVEISSRPGAGTTVSIEFPI